MYRRFRNSRCHHPHFDNRMLYYSRRRRREAYRRALRAERRKNRWYYKLIRAIKSAMKG